MTDTPAIDPKDIIIADLNEQLAETKRRLELLTDAMRAHGSRGMVVEWMPNGDLRLVPLGHLHGLAAGERLYRTEEKKT